MKTIEKQDYVEVIFSSNEFWYLCKLFSPGIVFGFDNPLSKLPDSEKVIIETETKATLICEGIIKSDDSGQIMVDEIIGGMIYSCINSYHLLSINDKKHNVTRYLHLMPGWQIIQSRNSGDYAITLCKEKETIWKCIFNEIHFSCERHEVGQRFSVGQHGFELALSLYQEGKESLAIKILDSSSPYSSIDWVILLSNFLSSQWHYSLDFIMWRNNPEKATQRLVDLIQIGDSLYWIRHIREAQDDPTFLEFNPVLSDEMRALFISMIKS